MGPAHDKKAIHGVHRDGADQQPGRAQRIRTQEHIRDPQPTRVQLDTVVLLGFRMRSMLQTGTDVFITLFVLLVGAMTWFEDASGMIPHFVGLVRQRPSSN